MAILYGFAARCLFDDYFFRGEREHFIRPFYRYGGHIEFIRFNKYIIIGSPGGMSTFRL